MRERQHDYEMMAIISPLRSSEDEITATIGRIQQTISNNGGSVSKVEHTPPWGRRKFAYPVRKYAEGEPSRRAFNEGYYVLFYFSLPTVQIPEFERFLKLNEAVLRYLITVIEHTGQTTPTAESQPVRATAPAEDEDGLNDEDEE